MLINKPQFKAIIFDMDGVLVDSEHWWQILEQQFLSSILGKWDDEKQKEIIGKSLKDIYNLLQSKYGLKMTYQKFLAAYNKMAKQIYESQCNLMPGVRETLEYFKKKGTKLALASSSLHSWIKMMLERFNLKDYFTSIVSAEDVGFRGKPAPDIYLYSAKQLNFRSDECLVIEDSTNGILAAKAAGMQVVGFQSEFNCHQDLSKADIIVDDLSKVIEISRQGFRN